MPDKERTAVMLHGTTVTRAQRIVEDEAFPSRTLYLVSRLHRPLAEYFALRNNTKYPREGGPALVRIEMPEEAFERLRRNGLLRLKPFSEGDRSELRSQSQWVLEGFGVDQLNSEIDDWSYERVEAAGPNAG